MTYADNELYSSTDKGDTSKRVDAEAIQPKTFASGSGDDVDPEIGLPVLTPLAVNSSTHKWVPWDANGANDTDTIRGFLWPDKLVLDDTDDMIANVLMRGKIHYDDVLAAVEERAVEVEADLLTELQNSSTLRTLGILVYGLASIQ